MSSPVLIGDDELCRPYCLQVTTSYVIPACWCRVGAIRWCPVQRRSEVVTPRVERGIYSRHEDFEEHCYVTWAGYMVVDIFVGWAVSSPMTLSWIGR